MSVIKIKPEKIAFDIDGVVADTMAAFLNVARDEFGINSIKKEQITTYWLEECLPIGEDVIKAIIERILTDPFGIGLSPIEGCLGVLKRLSEDSPLRFVTARPVKTPIKNWLDAVLEGVPPERIQVIATGKHEIKVEVLKELGIGYFVEDHMETCRAMCKRGINAIVFDQPWNQGPAPFVRVKSWQELEKLLDV